MGKLRSKLTYVYDLARKHLRRNAERQANLYNRRKHGETFIVGDLVWYANKLRKKGLSPKLQPKWRGPCLVIKMYNDVLAEIKLSMKKSIIVHTDLLKPCHSTHLPVWLKRTGNPTDERRVILMTQTCGMYWGFPLSILSWAILSSPKLF